MSSTIKSGDCVRVTEQRLVHGYQAGSRGTVQQGPATDRSGKTYYAVLMDRDGSQDATLFLADEIELAP